MTFKGDSSIVSKIAFLMNFPIKFIKFFIFFVHIIFLR